MKRTKIYLVPALLALIMLTLSLGGFSTDALGTSTAEESDDDICAECHDELSAAFHQNTHGRIRAFEVRGEKTGCLSCHVDAEKHVEEGGDPEVMTTFSEMKTNEASAVCLNCHQNANMSHWQLSAHAQSDVGCLDCHDIHATEGSEQHAAGARCYECHNDVQAEMMLPSHHPIAEGKMSCNSCHNPHGTSVDSMVKSNERMNDLCLTCHSQYQGPFIFEHSPVAEDCSICHTPHGSVVNNLLTENEPYLCLQCHEMHFHTGAKGLTATEVYDPNRDIMQPNPNTTKGWKIAFATKCSQCHAMVHGSDLPSQGITSQGNSLTR